MPEPKSKLEIHLLVVVVLMAAGYEAAQEGQQLNDIALALTLLAAVLVLSLHFDQISMGKTLQLSRKLNQTQQEADQLRSQYASLAAVVNQMQVQRQTQDASTNIQFYYASEPAYSARRSGDARADQDERLTGAVETSSQHAKRDVDTITEFLQQYLILQEDPDYTSLAAAAVNQYCSDEGLAGAEPKYNVRPIQAPSTNSLLAVRGPVFDAVVIAGEVHYLFFVRDARYFALYWAESELYGRCATAISIRSQSTRSVRLVMLLIDALRPQSDSHALKLSYTALESVKRRFEPLVDTGLLEFRDYSGKDFRGPTE